MSADQVGWSGAGQEVVSVVDAPVREAGEKIEDDGEAHLKIIDFLESVKAI